MSKKLKIKFWKTERVLAMQILEQEGLPTYKNKGQVWITTHPSINCSIQLRGSHKDCDLGITHKRFSTNTDRDQCLDRLTQAITDELFSGTGALKIGEYCEVRSIGLHIGNWKKLRLIAVLPPNIYKRYICESLDSVGYFEAFEEARPLGKRIEPMVEENGEIVTYIWEK